MSKINLSFFHPIADIQENVIFARNGNVVLAYEAHLPEIYSLSEKDFEDIHSAWFHALKSLPTGCVVHKQDLYLKKEYSSAKLPNRTFLEKATYEHFKGREYMDHRSFIFFLLTRNKALNNPKFVNPFRKMQKSLPQELDENLKRFQGVVNDSVSFINNSRKLELEPMKAEDILTLTNAYFNGFNEGFDTNIILEKSNIGIADNQFDILAVNSELCFGESVQSSKTNDRFTSDDFVFHQGFIDGLGLTLNENHIVNQIIYLDDKQKWRKLLDKKVEELNKSSNFGSQNKVVLQKIKHILDRVNEDDTARIIRGQLNVIYWDKDPYKLSLIGSRIKTEFKELDIIPFYPKGEERKNYFLNSYCCFSSNFSNEDLYVTDLKHSLCLLINNSNYKSDAKGIIFNDREHNIPVLKDVWDEKKKRIKARNFAIFAPTGEGKSFLANNILRQYFENGVRLVIIDLGGSYTKFAKLYPQRYTILRYENGKNLGINPFYISSPEDLTAERLEDLSVFLFELLAAGMEVTKAQAVSIKKILRSYYLEEKENYSLESFYAYIDKKRSNLLEELKIHPDYFNINNFLHIMSEYVGEGIYSFLFEVGEDQTYKIEDKRLIVFELDEVKDNKEILSVMLKLIKSAIQRTIWKNRAEKGIILFDEFAKQLKFENVLESVEFYYQAIRKQTGAIGIILQSINQLPNNSTSASILENTQVIYSLHNEKGYEELRKRLNLSAHDLNQLKSIITYGYGLKWVDLNINLSNSTYKFNEDNISNNISEDFNSVFNLTEDINKLKAIISVSLNQTHNAKKTIWYYQLGANSTFGSFLNNSLINGTPKIFQNANDVFVIRDENNQTFGFYENIDKTLATGALNAYGAIFFTKKKNFGFNLSAQHEYLISKPDNTYYENNFSVLLGPIFRKEKDGETTLTFGIDVGWENGLYGTDVTNDFTGRIRVGIPFNIYTNTKKETK